MYSVAAAAGEFCWSSTPGGREPFLRLGSSEKPLERRDHDGCDHDAGRDQALGQGGTRRSQAESLACISARIWLVPLSINEASRALLTYSVGAARVRANDGGDLLRLDKRGGTQFTTRRDDVAAAAIFAAGANARMPAPARLELVSV